MNFNPDFTFFCCSLTMKLNFIYLVLSTFFIHVPLFNVAIEYKSFNFLTGSPFCINKQIYRQQFLKLACRGEERKSLFLVKSVVKIEKAWRHRYCVRVFGVANCAMKISDVNPFYLWKRKMIFDLRKDPAGEIFGFFRQALLTLINNGRCRKAIYLAI